MFGIGLPEMFLILAIALIIIGPKKLPDMAKSLGRALGEFKKATSDLKDSVGLKDEDLRDVKKVFNDMNKDVKNSILAASTDTEKKPSPGQRTAEPPPATDEEAPDKAAKSPPDTPPETSQAGDNAAGSDDESAPESGK